MLLRQRCKFRHKVRVSILRKKNVRVAAMEMPVERLQNVERVVLFQRIRCSVVGDVKLEMLLVLRRDKIVRIAEGHHRQRRQLVLRGLTRIVDRPPDQFSSITHLILTEGQWKKLCLIQEQLGYKNIGIVERKVGQESLEIPYYFFKTCRVVYKHLHDIPRVAGIDFLPRCAHKRYRNRTPGAESIDAPGIGVVHVEKKRRGVFPETAARTAAAVDEPQRHPFCRRIDIE